MSKPDFIVDKSAHTRSRAGALRTSIVQRLHDMLMDNGSVLLPSDTCYSLAMAAKDNTTYERINTILARKPEPISLAFPNYLAIQRFADVDPLTAALLERFSPGPITVVCKAKGGIPELFLTHTIASARGTIGIRIPDSSVEREVAACTPYPITTVAVRDPRTRDAVRDLEHALQIVEAGMARVDNLPWAAVAGDEVFYAQHSTVVEIVGGTPWLKLLREGDIPFKQILETSKSISGLALERLRSDRGLK